LPALATTLRSGLGRVAVNRTLSCHLLVWSAGGRGSGGDIVVIPQYRTGRVTAEVPYEIIVVKVIVVKVVIIKASA
jgi:hypothetical protein